MAIMYKILLVDDTEINIDILVDVLGDDYELSVAMDGESALEAVEDELPDLILLDIMMPGIDGYEVCKRLKNNPKTRDVPIIFLSAKTEEGDETKGLKLGAVDYISKPINVPILLARVKTHIQLKAEKDKSEKLIHNILPSTIAEELKRTGKTRPVSFEKTAVLLADLVGFTEISSTMLPKKLINELNILFTKYDVIMEQNQCERIKTIGDAYMAVSGMLDKDDYYADHIVKAAVEILLFLKERRKTSQYPWETRLGIDSGEVVGGVVGVKKYIYDIFGTTVNMASRLESATKVYKLSMLISDNVFNNMVSPDEFCIREIDMVMVKGEDRAIKLYEVYDGDDEDVIEKKKATALIFSKAIKDYRLGRIDQALELFYQCQEQCEEDTLPPIYIERCKEYRDKELPDDWKGISSI